MCYRTWISLSVLRLTHKHLNITSVVLLTYHNMYRVGRGSHSQRRICSENTYMCVNMYICLHVYQTYNICKSVRVICTKFLNYWFAWWHLSCTLCPCTIPLTLPSCFHRYFQHISQLCESSVVPCSKNVAFIPLKPGTTWNFTVTLDHGNTLAPQFFTIWSMRFSFRLVNLTPERGKEKQLCWREIHVVPFVQFGPESILNRA